MAVPLILSDPLLSVGCVGEVSCVPPPQAVKATELATAVKAKAKEA